MSLLTLLAIGSAISVLGFAAVWAISVRVKNYGFLDVAFSYGVAILAPLYAWQGPAPLSRKLAFMAIGVAWSLRLGSYILARVLRHHPKEDVRYETLRKRWPGPGMFLLFFEMQAILVVIFSLPFLFASFNLAPTLAPLEIAGLLLAGLSLLCEALADFQMQQFKADSANHGEVCQAGLWRYSRHPNYFFEWLTWCGFSLAALGSPLGWIALLCPALMFYFLFKVTGIPLTEEYALKSKGERYRAYQKSTSAFVPWFPKSSSDS